MSMRINELIKSRREKLGLSAKQVAERCGFSMHEYDDIEQHPDEALTVVDLKRLRRLVEALGLDLSDFLRREREQMQMDASAMEGGPALSRTQLIHQHRLEKCFSFQELVDQLGFDVSSVVRLESDPEYLEELPLEPLREIASLLDIPLRRFLSQ